ncbi:MAG: B-box zinc finger protein [Actinobacteria bacterium]|nr:B-box zinc finger protein [Actinomycetota bacterium]
MNERMDGKSAVHDESELHCANHPKRSTKVSCSSCGKPICPECMVFGPVGVKCRECASHARSATRAGKPSQFAGSVLYGLGASVLGSMAIIAIMSAMPYAGFLSFFIYIGYGYAVGEAVARGAKGNRGPAFMAIAGGCAALGLIPMLGGGLFGLLFIGLAVWVAASRLSG